MLHVEDVEIFFKSRIDISYKDELDRLFFFNGNQHKYEEIVEQSLDDYATPVLKEYDSKVAIVFNKKNVGQTLHILDSDQPDAELIGVVMYARDSVDTITIVHFVLHEECRVIMDNSDVNIALIVLDRLMGLFRKLRGVKRIRIYYTNKVISL